MPNVYQAETDDGKVHDVTTQEHHDDHTDTSFKQHLGRVIDGTAGSFAGATVFAVVRKYVFKGRI